LDHVDLLQRRHDQELKVQLLEEIEAVARRFVRAAAEGLVDRDEPERARALRAPFEAELISEARGEHGVGELLLLASGLAARIGVVLVLAVVLAPALRRREHEPVAHVRDLARPPLVELRLTFASAKALDDRLHLQELLLRVLLVLGSGDYALGARAQAREE